MNVLLVKGRYDPRLFDVERHPRAPKGQHGKYQGGRFVPKPYRAPQAEALPFGSRRQDLIDQIHAEYAETRWNYASAWDGYKITDHFMARARILGIKSDVTIVTLGAAYGAVLKARGLSQVSSHEAQKGMMRWLRDARKADQTELREQLVEKIDRLTAPIVQHVERLVAGLPATEVKSLEVVKSLERQVRHFGPQIGAAAKNAIAGVQETYLAMSSAETFGEQVEIWRERHRAAAEDPKRQAEAIALMDMEHEPPEGFVGLLHGYIASRAPRVPGSPASVKSSVGIDPKVHEVVSLGLAKYCVAVQPETLARVALGIGSKKGYRASASGTTAQLSRSRAASAGGLEAAIHEIAHVVELQIPEWSALAHAFLNSRTLGAPTVGLKSIDRLRGYRADEKTRPDGFFSPYVGKHYSGGETEVCTMALQEILGLPEGSARPAKLWIRDPQHFAIGIALIHMTPDQIAKALE